MSQSFESQYQKNLKESPFIITCYPSNYAIDVDKQYLYQKKLYFSSFNKNQILIFEQIQDNKQTGLFLGYFKSVETNKYIEIRENQLKLTSSKPNNYTTIFFTQSGLASIWFQGNGWNQLVAVGNCNYELQNNKQISSLNFSWGFLVKDKGTFRDQKIIISNDFLGYHFEINPSSINPSIQPPQSSELKAKINEKGNYSLSLSNVPLYLTLKEKILFSPYQQDNSDWAIIQNVLTKFFYLMSMSNFKYLSLINNHLTCDLPNIYSLNYIFLINIINQYQGNQIQFQHFQPNPPQFQAGNQINNYSQSLQDGIVNPIPEKQSYPQSINTNFNVETKMSSSKSQTLNPAFAQNNTNQQVVLNKVDKNSIKESQNMESFRIRNEGSQKYWKVTGNGIEETPTSHEGSTFERKKIKEDYIQLYYLENLVGVLNSNSTSSVQILDEKFKKSDGTLIQLVDNKYLQINGTPLSIVGGKLFVADFRKNSSLQKFQSFIFEPCNLHNSDYVAKSFLNTHKNEKEFKEEYEYQQKYNNVNENPVILQANQNQQLQQKQQQINQNKNSFSSPDQNGQFNQHQQNYNMNNQYQNQPNYMNIHQVAQQKNQLINIKLKLNGQYLNSDQNYLLLSSVPSLFTLVHSQTQDKYYITDQNNKFFVPINDFIQRSTKFIEGKNISLFLIPPKKLFGMNLFQNGNYISFNEKNNSLNLNFEIE